MGYGYLLMGATMSILVVTLSFKVNTQQWLLFDDKDVIGCILKGV